MRISEGVRYNVGDRVVVVVDDTTRGIVLAERSSGGATTSLATLPYLARLAPEQVAEIYVLTRQEALTRAAPCTVERGLAIRTKR